MLFSWLRKRRRRRLTQGEFPAEWLRFLQLGMPFYDRLAPADQKKLRDDIRIFIAERNWEGCDGLEINDEMQVVIAAYACLLVLRSTVDAYHKLDTILVYPDPYMAMKSAFPLSEPEPVGWRDGESWSDGPVILAWNKLVDNIRDDDGDNLAIHEFSHQLDTYDRSADGVPQLQTRQQYDAWRQVMTEEFQQLNEDADAGRRTLLDHYGAQDEAEFFAVATECFFLRGKKMKQQHERLYQVLSDYYQQDPASIW